MEAMSALSTGKKGTLAFFKGDEGGTAIGNMVSHTPSMTEDWDSPTFWANVATWMAKKQPMRISMPSDFHVA